MPVRFRKQWLASESYESAGVAHFFGEATPQIISGAWCYYGSDFGQKRRIWTPPASGEYYDDFSTIALDATGNGYPDVVTGGFFGSSLFLLKNPGLQDTGMWECVTVDQPGNIETTRAWDLDGDGHLEIVPNVPRGDLVVYKLVLDGLGQPTGKFHTITLKAGPQGHGLGAADMTGNGRLDILLHNGWLEAPENLWEEDWKFHPVWDIERASIPMLAHDFDGDGRPEMVTSDAHGYRFSWFSECDGKWAEHPIDPFNSQYHDMQLCDIDGDGELEVVTGKRYYAHNGNDPGADDDLGIYYFKWNGFGFTKQVIDYGPLGTGKGCGIHFAIGDLNSNGRPDIVAPGKDGLCIYWNEGLSSEL